MTSVSNDTLRPPPASDEPVLPNRLRNPAYLRRDATAYLDGVARELEPVKVAIREFLEPRPGQALLDVGCGTGNDVLALAEQVGPDGRAVGVDASEELIAKAESRRGDRSWVEFHIGDAADLPFLDNSFDAARVERVLQHVPDPAKAVAELLRVTRPGGRVVLAEPDHDMWVVDASDVATTRELMSWWVDHIRNPWIGRRLPSLLTAAGAEAVRLNVLPIVLSTMAASDAVIGLSRVADAARAADVVPVQRLDAWRDDLARRDADGGVLTLGGIVVAYGVKPAG